VAQAAMVPSPSFWFMSCSIADAVGGIPATVEILEMAAFR
jgi:hypothetical protein